MKGKFLCFRPIASETEHESGFVNCFGDHAFAFNNVASNKDSKLSVVPSQVLNGESVKCSKLPVHRSSGNNSSGRRKSKVKRSLSAVIKAVLFEISLSKKAQRKRKAPRLMLDSGISESKSNSSSSLLSSSSSTNSCSSSHSVPALAPKKPNKKLAPNTQSSLLEQRKQSENAIIEVKTENRVTSCSSSRSGLLLIVIVLSVTIFYGRILAILLTSLCLYSLSPQRRLQENVARSPPVTELSAGDCRKRVIMEGLLERNHQLRRGP